MCAVFGYHLGWFERTLDPEMLDSAQGLFGAQQGVLPGCKKTTAQAVVFLDGPENLKSRKSNLPAQSVFLT